MDILNEWIGQTVERDLGDVLEWRTQSNANRDQSVGKIGNLTFEEDGSNLRIYSAQPKVIQIAKFLTNAEPVQVVLSDSVTRINAIISKDAVQKYTQKTQKRLADGTLGGLIQLLSFEIVATHIGSRAKRITLFVTDFKTLGSNGSGPQGCPSAIEDRAKIRELIQKLIDFRGQEFAGRRGFSKHALSSKASSPISQNDTSSQDDQKVDSQTTFATQVPPPRGPRHNNKQRKPIGNSLKSYSPFRELDGKILADVGSSRLANLGAAGTGVLIDPSIRLQNGRHATTTHKRNIPLTGEEELLALLPRQGAKYAPDGLTNSNFARADIQLDSPSSGVNIVDTFRSAQSSSIPKNGATDRSSCASPGVPTSIITNVPGTPEEQAAVEILEHTANSQQMSAKTEPKSRTRISNREIKISKDQEKLLSGADSWMPAEPGRREPVANMPIAILQSLNHRADLQAKGPPNLTKAKSNSVKQDEQTSTDSHSSFEEDKSGEDGSGSETESDAPLSSSEWPLSPQRSQLPPDSSIETENLGPSKGQKVRRLSNISSPSSPTKSKQSSPVRSPASSRDSAKSSPKIRPSSTATNQIGSDHRQYRCEVFGCKEPCDEPESLESHINECHVTALCKDFRCNSNDHAKACKDLRDLSSHGKVSGTDVQQSPSDTPHSFASQASTPSSKGLKILGSGITRVDYGEDRDDHDSVGKPLSTQGNTLSPERLNNSSRDSPVQKHGTSLALSPDTLSVSRSSKPVISSTNLLKTNTNEGSSSLSAISPSPDSDLEMVIPLPLDSQPAASGHRFSQAIPSTAPLPPEPFTQVKRTPYVNGQAHRYRDPPRQKRRLSPTMYDFPPSPECDTHLDDVDHVTQSAPSVVEASSSEYPPHKPLGQIADLEQVAAEVVDAVNDGDIIATRSNSHMEFNQNSDLGLEVEDDPKVMNIAMSSSALSIDTFEASSPSAKTDISSHVVHENRETKRKAPDLEFLSPNVAKRRKKFKVPRTFNNIEDANDRPDPMEGAKRYRKAFLDSCGNKTDFATEGELPALTLASKKASECKKLISESGDLYASSELSTKSLSLVSSNHQAGPLKPTQIPQPRPHQSLGIAIELSKAAPVDAAGEKIAIAESGAQDDDVMDIEEPGSRDTTQSSESAMPAGEGQNVAIDGEGLSIDENISPTPKALTTCSAEPQDRLFPSQPKLHDKSPVVLQNPSPQKYAKTDGPSFNQVIRQGSKTSFPATLFNAGQVNQADASGPVVLDPTKTSRDISQGQLPRPTEITSMSSIIPIAGMRSEDSPTTKLPTPVDRPFQAPHSIFDKFKAAYHMYPGDMKHFVTMCRKIKSLWKTHLHQCLWDDFIIRHKIEYAQHLRICAEDGEDALPYEDFYRTEIEEPLYQKRVITPRNLEDATSVLGQSLISSKMHSSEGPGPAIEENYENFSSRKPSRAEKLKASNPKLPNHHVTVSLISDDENPSPGKLSKNTSMTSSTGGPRKSRRSLPWIDDYIKHGHGPSTASKEPNNPSGTRRVSSTSRTEPTAEEKDMRTAWGIGAHDVLAPQYCDKIDYSHIELIRDIAYITNLQEARRLIYETIHSRTALDPSEMKTVTMTDLKVVLDIIKRRTSREHVPISQKASNEGRQHTTHANGSRTTKGDGLPGPWWKDDNTPFKGFVKAYRAIRNGNGNSWAQAGPATKQSENPRRKKKKKVPEKENRIDESCDRA